MAISIFPKQKYNESRELDKIAQLYNISGMDRAALKRLVIQAVWLQGPSNMPLREEMTRLAQAEKPSTKKESFDEILEEQRKLTLKNTNISGLRIDPAVDPTPYLTLLGYGHEQLSLALKGYSLATLRAMAAKVTVYHPGLKPPQSRESDVIRAWIVEHTRGDYERVMNGEIPVQENDHIPYYVYYDKRYNQVTRRESVRRPITGKAQEPAPATKRTLVPRQRREEPMTPHEKRVAQRSAKSGVSPRNKLDGYKIDPFAPLDPYFFQYIYGDDQLNAALSEQTLVSLKGAAHTLMRDYPGSGTPHNESDKQSTIDYITKTVHAHPRHWDGKEWVDTKTGKHYPPPSSRK